MMTASRFKEIYTRYQCAGLTVCAFCRNEALVESRFYYWLRKLRQTSAHCTNESGEFIPLMVNHANESILPAAEPVPTHSLPPCGASVLSSCEIIYPNGVQLKFQGHIRPEDIHSFIRPEK
jgi:hypothetical protein